MSLPQCIFTGYAQHWILDGESFVPRMLPIGHPCANVIRVSLDCSSRSRLQWDIPTLDTWVLWELETDLWQYASLEEPAILSYELAIDHFVTTVLPHHRTFGVLVYKGSAPVPYTLLRSLSARLPDNVIPFIALDLSEYQEASSFFHALQREELAHFGLIVKGGAWPYAIPALGWDQPSVYGYYSDCEQEILPQQRLTTALCYGPETAFQLPKEPCRVIPEACLTDEWDGIDILYTAGLTSKGERKARGLAAAGAQIL